MKNFVKVAMGAAIFASSVFSAGVFAQTGNPGGAINDNLGEMDYGVCRGTDPACYHDWERPEGWDSEWRVLLFTKTGGPRHGHLGTRLGEGLNPPLNEDNYAQRGVIEMLEAEGIHVDYTEDSSQLRSLNSYHAVIFYSTTRDNLDDNAQTYLRQYIRRGGGFVGVHNAFGTEYNWPYYEGLIGGANFFNHGPNRPGEVVLQSTTDTSTRDLPARFAFTDEWYNLVPFPTHVRFLATAIPSTPEPRTGGGGRGGLSTVTGNHPGHGDFHPVTWCQYYDGGKSWVTTLGHSAEMWTDPSFEGGAEFKTMLLGGIKSVMGMEPFCQ